MSDVQQKAIVFENISVITKPDNLDTCSACDMQVVLEMIIQIADEARGKY